MANFELGESAVAVTPKIYPKKAKRAYFYFNGQYIRSVIANDATISRTQAMKLAGTKWGTISDQEKEPFEKLAANDKARFERETEELET